MTYVLQVQSDGVRVFELEVVSDDRALFPERIKEGIYTFFQEFPDSRCMNGDIEFIIGPLL